MKEHKKAGMSDTRTSDGLPQTVCPWCFLILFTVLHFMFFYKNITVVLKKELCTFVCSVSLLLFQANK